jgi:NhaP-type Na+/H+ or K+/H+ antiporter
MLGIVSLSIGLIFGFLTSYIFKHAKFLRVNAITETFLIFSFSMASYFVAQSIIIAGIEMSGIISLLTCGIVQSHYTYYNLSPQGKTTATLTVTFLGTACESAVYSYIGIALYAQIASWWSFSFIFYQLLIIMSGRFCAIFGTFYLFRLCFKKKTINARELCFIVYAGMIRGAIAFALVLRIPVEGTIECKTPGKCVTEETYQVLISTTLILVMVTTVLFGTFMSRVQNFLVPPTQEDKEEYEMSQRKESYIMSKALQKRRASSNFNDSHYEEILHPNEEKELDESAITEAGGPSSWATSRFVKWFSLWDENVLRPMFIRKYNKAV